MGRVWLCAGMGLLAAACSGTSMPGGPNETTMVPDAGPAGPFDITIASSPPIELPGTALWLDADYGVARDGTQVRAWTDRSGLGHVFERQAAGDPGPTIEPLAGHRALRFGGHARMGLSPAVEERGRAALTLGPQDFLVALVVHREGGGPEPTLFALAAPEAQRPTAELKLKPGLRFDLNGAVTTTPATLDGAGPQMVVVLVAGGTVTVRLDGQEAGSAPVMAAELPFLIPYVGGWALEPEGFAGLLGDVVVVAGPDAAGAVEPLETYLRQKYGL